MLVAVKDYGGALEYADDGPKADREVVLEAMKQRALSIVLAARQFLASTSFPAVTFW